MTISEHFNIDDLLAICLDFAEGINEVSGDVSKRNRLDFMTSIVLVHATRIQTYAHGPQSGERLRPMLVLWLTTAMVR